jgi:hypothetical protein
VEVVGLAVLYQEELRTLHPPQLPLFLTGAPEIQTGAPAIQKAVLYQEELRALHPLQLPLFLTRASEIQTGGPELQKAVLLEWTQLSQILEFVF